MNGDRDGGERCAVGSLAELLACALLIETEAADRYADLADQMEVHNNLEVAELFRKLAAIEGLHIDQVRRMSDGIELPRVAPWDLHRPGGGESPEAPRAEDVHYLMTPYHALALALAEERRAAAFFAHVAGTTEDPEVRRTARELTEEEHEHVALLEQWLARYPEPEEGWDEDPDPRTLQE